MRPARHHPSLFARCEVTLFRTRYVTAIVAVEINSAEGSVVFEVGRCIGECVLAAQFFFNVFKAGGHLFYRRWEKYLAASIAGELSEHLIAATATGRPIGADGVDDGLGALTHLDGFIEMHSALVVVAVRH